MIAEDYDDLDRDELVSKLLTANHTKNEFAKALEAYETQVLALELAHKEVVAERDAYKAVFDAQAKATQFLQDEATELGLNAGENRIIKGVPALKAQRDALEEKCHNYSERISALETELSSAQANLAHADEKIRELQEYIQGGRK